MKYVRFMMQSIFVLLMVAVAGLFLVPLLPIQDNIELRIVQSGSMEPSIMTGALIVVRPVDSYAIGDVITFTDRNASVPTTHRIVEMYDERGQTWFITKGDANEEADAMAVSSRDVLGVVAFDVPRVGFILDFARQPLGFILLIVLPAFLIVLSELEKIWRELRGRRAHNATVMVDAEAGLDETLFSDVASVSISDHPHRMMDIATPVRYLELPTLDLRRLAQASVSAAVDVSQAIRWGAVAAVLLFAVLVAGSSMLQHTVSYFHDTEVSTGNTLVAVALDFTATSDQQMLDFAAGGPVGGGGEVTLTITPTAESVGLRYDVAAVVTGGDADFCGVLHAVAPEPVNVDGLLASLAAADILISDPVALSVAVSDETTLVGGEQCTVDLTFTAWHEAVADKEGYFDTEVVALQFAYLPTVAIQTISPSMDSAELIIAESVLEAGADSGEAGVDPASPLPDHGSRSGNGSTAGGGSAVELPPTAATPVTERSQMTPEGRTPAVATVDADTVVETAAVVELPAGGEAAATAGMTQSEQDPDLIDDVPETDGPSEGVVEEVPVPETSQLSVEITAPEITPAESLASDESSQEQAPAIELVDEE